MNGEQNTEQPGLGENMPPWRQLQVAFWLDVAAKLNNPDNELVALFAQRPGRFRYRP